MKYYRKYGEKESYQFVPTLTQQQVITEENGFASAHYELKELDCDKVNYGLKVSDFKLSTLIANNAVDLLQPNRVIPQSNLAVAATAENFE